MTTLACILIAVPLVFFGYAYVVYPLLLRLFARLRPTPVQWGDPPDWPSISITIPAYNEERAIRRTIESLLALDYPADRRQILIVSDASTDATDAIVREYANRGVELLRLPERAGKTAGENAAVPLLRGEIVVNTDATIRILPDSLKPLIRVFQDPTIGAASGRDVSVGDITAERTAGESGYVDYEMRVRSLETRVGSIIGASGCFYAIRRSIVDSRFPAALSRDFASPLRARKLGYRTVSVDEAICLVARTASLEKEFTRKVRTMARGLETLRYMRELLNPIRYGSFAWMLWSHKLCRWLVPFAMIVALVDSAMVAPASPFYLALFVIQIAFYVAAVGGLMTRASTLRIPAFFVLVNVAILTAWFRYAAGERMTTWRPSERVAAIPQTSSR
jgi:cellulose synthase/poly-beta-1,6-N-acetylglucosamine synthase-like glycosyltransferase